MKPRLIVHIGSPKTGSSSIQKAVFDARGRLRSECGTCFASTERAPRPSKHVSVTKAATSGDEKKSEFEYRALMEDFERSGCSTLLITEEELFVVTPSVPKFFSQFSAQFDIDVVCYLRRNDLFVESLYNQIIRLRKYRDVPPINEFWRDPRIRQRIDYHKLLMGWREIGANVIAMDFTREVKVHGLLPSFLRATKLTKLGELPDKTANTSSDMRLLLTLCLVSSGEIQKDHNALVKGMAKAGQALEGAGLYKALKATLGSVERESVLHHCAKSNELLASDFGVTFGNDRPSEGLQPIHMPEAEYLLALIGQMSLLDIRRLQQCCRNNDYAPTESFEDD